MAYFNNAFFKTFVASSADVAGGVSTAALTAGQLGLVVDSNWETIAVPGGVVPANSLAYLVQGSFYTKDSIGNNPGHGGYKESVKSKGINPKYISRVWEVDARAASQATASLSLGAECTPCGTTQFMRMDVKGSPALRFLNHNAYAIGDSANICCADGQEFLDPALVLATEAAMILENALIKPFVSEPSGGGIVVSVTDAAGAVVSTTYTIAQAMGTAASGNYTPSLTPNAAAATVSATVSFVGAYVDTKFGNCSFDTRDHYNAEPVEIIASILDETGNPCNDCGTATRTPGSMEQTQGEEVVRALILSERYRQSPYNQGNADSARIREVEMSDELLGAVDRSAVYKAYYVQHVVPRFNNPSSTFDNDQYVYQIFVKDTDTAAKTAVEAILAKLVVLANGAGNNIAVETNLYW